MTPTSILTPKQRRSHISKFSLQNKLSKNNLKVQETRTGYHYELKIPGYIREDFNFYVEGNDLVITTDKSKTSMAENSSDNRKRHHYCYPSAYFKMRIPLPSHIVSNKISVNYVDEVLSFDLFKLKSY